MTDRKDKSAGSGSNERKRAITAADIKYAEKLAKILDYRELGVSIRQISERMEADGFAGCSRSQVHRMLVKALERQLKEDKMKFAHYHRLELNKIDRAELALFPEYLKLVHALKIAGTNEEGTTLVIGDVEEHCRAIEKLSAALDRIWKRKDSLLGLNKPIKHEHTGQDGQPIETSIITRVILPEVADTGTDEEE